LSVSPATEDNALGIAFITSLLIALWCANAGMKALFEAMNVACDEKEARVIFSIEQHAGDLGLHLYSQGLHAHYYF